MSSSIADLRSRIMAALQPAIIGQEDAIDLMLVALLARGHVLLEGPPGTAKTFLARSFAAVLGLDYGRIQFTPDLMPGDILGTSLFDFQTSRFNFTPGPVFCQLLLADEINRTPPKTQSALLEAMQERRVTVDGATRPLPEHFMVVATQNPIEQQGVYPLPEAQLDRFLFKHLMRYPDAGEEARIIALHGAGIGTPDPESLGLSAITSPEEIAAAQAEVAAIPMVPDVVDYVVRLIRVTRNSADIACGASPRAGAMLASAARARAALDGRDYVLPDDVKALAPAALRHRLLLSPAAEIEGRHPDGILERLMAEVDAPR